MPVYTKQAKGAGSSHPHPGLGAEPIRAGHPGDLPLTVVASGPHILVQEDASSPYEHRATGAVRASRNRRRARLPRAQVGARPATEHLQQIRTLTAPVLGAGTFTARPRCSPAAQALAPTLQPPAAPHASAPKARTTRRVQIARYPMRKLELLANCDACTGLCCVAYPFDKSADFAFDKASGEPCQHLTEDHRCAIHPTRAERGYTGCITYDCHGAGQHVAAHFGHEPEAVRHQVFIALRHIHEQLFQLNAALGLCPRGEVALRAQLTTQASALRELANNSAQTIIAFNLRRHETSTAKLLRAVGHAISQQTKTA